MIIAEFQVSIRPAIPHLIALLSDSDEGLCTAGADAFLKLSEQGKPSNFLIWRG